MFQHVIVAASFSAWAVVMWAVLPKAYRLEMKAKPAMKKSFKRLVPALSFR